MNVVKIIGLVSILIILSLIVVLVPWLIQFSGSSFSPEPSSWGIFGDYFGGIFSSLISVFGFVGVIITIVIQSRTISAQLDGMVQEKEIRDDEVYSKQSLECLSEAYVKLKAQGDGSLYRDRVAWLESARLIITAQNLSKRIKSESVQEAYRAAEKVVRSKFSSLLSPDNSPSTMQPTFFHEMDWDRWAEGQRQRPIERTSVFVIYRFASWGEDESDELDSLADEVNAEVINLRYFGAKRFVEQSVQL
ncbi:hypothetical protein BG51_15995 [Pseudomonas [fluorescens] ATCC 17400]